MKKCALCGLEFAPHHPIVRYCSDLCRAKAANRNQVKFRARIQAARASMRKPVICYVCRREFVPRQSKQRLCGLTCRAKAAAIKAAQWNATVQGAALRDGPYEAEDYLSSEARWFARNKDKE